MMKFSLLLFLIAYNIVGHTQKLSLKKDKSLAFALLLSEKLPDNKSLKEAKNKLLSIEGCIK